MKEDFFLPIIERAKKADKVIIVGAKETGTKLLYSLLQEGIEVEAFFDNNTELQGEKVENIPVRAPEKCDGDCLYIIASANYYHELECQLLQLGIMREDIMEYCPIGSYGYYKRIDPCYYKEEIEDRYRLKMGQELNLDNPQKFTEKIQWLILNEQNPEKSTLADKYAVREYVKNKIGDKYLIPLLGHWKEFNEIDFSMLPNQFVLKCNHGCSMNIVVKNKNEMNYESAKADINRWLKMNFAYRNLELHYKAIKPQIIAEMYIQEIDGNLFDYKVHCFNGEPVFLQVIGDRDLIAHTGYQLVYDFNWKKQNWSFGDYPKYKYDLEQPVNLDELYAVCKILSAGWRYVRLDFYIIEGKLLFGEMTFTPATGIYIYNEDWTIDIDYMLGKKIVL